MDNQVIQQKLIKKHSFKWILITSGTPVVIVLMLTIYASMTSGNVRLSLPFFEQVFAIELQPENPSTSELIDNIFKNGTSEEVTALLNNRDFYKLNDETLIRELIPRIEQLDYNDPLSKQLRDTLFSERGPFNPPEINVRVNVVNSSELKDKFARVCPQSIFFDKNVLISNNERLSMILVKAAERRRFGCATNGEPETTTSVAPIEIEIPEVLAYKLFELDTLPASFNAIAKVTLTELAVTTPSAVAKLTTNVSVAQRHVKNQF